MDTSSEAEESSSETPVSWPTFFFGSVKPLCVDPETNVITGIGSEVEVFAGAPVRQYVILQDTEGNPVRCMELYALLTTIDKVYIQTGRYYIPA